MARANKRLPSSVSVSKSAIDSATSTLQGLPEKPKESWSLREAVSVLQESISAALSKGYSYEEVATMLSTKGVDISASSLKSYLSAAKRQSGTTSTTKRRGGRRPKSEEVNGSMNGSSAHPTPSTNSKTALSALSEPNALTVIADTEVELPAKKPTRRKSKAEPAPTPRKTAAKAKPAAKTSAVSKTKATPRTPSRTRKKNG
jgi:hypothetical protein